MSSSSATVAREISKSTTVSLLIRPKRCALESTEGYWLRIADLNGLADPGWLLSVGQRRPLSIIRFCPLCLRQPGGKWLEEWKDRSVPCCEEHRIWLIDSCASCGALLRWSNVGFRSCRCGQDLRELLPRVLSAEMNRVLETGAASLPVLLWFGSLDRHGLAMKPLKKASRVVLSEVVDLAEAGARIVEGWPTTFTGVLDRNRQDASLPPGVRTLNDTFPGFARCASKLRDVTWRSRTTDALASYVGASQLSNRPIVWRAAPTSPQPTVAHIARELGIGPKGLLAALDRIPAASVSVRHTAHGRSRRLVSPDSIRLVQQALQDRLSVKAAAVLVGVGAGRLRQLIAGGLLEPSNGSLSRKAVMDLLRSLTLQRTDSKPADDLVPLITALRRYVPIGSTADFFRSILDGSTTVVACTNSADLKQAFVSVAQCRNWGSEPMHKNGRELTLPECAALLGLKQQVVYHLARVGLLAVYTTESNSGRPRSVVGATELERFRGRYESLARLAAAAGVARQAALLWARSKGMSLVSGPTIDGGRQYFARRP